MGGPRPAPPHPTQPSFELEVGGGEDGTTSENHRGGCCLKMILRKPMTRRQEGHIMISGEAGRKSN